jgi:hypothetical protein
MVVELVAEQVVDPGELRGDLAGAEVEVRVGDGRDDRTVAAVRVVVRGQHQLLCSHSRVTPSATSSIHSGSSVSAASTAARVSRRSRAKTICSYASRSPSRKYRA